MKRIIVGISGASGVAYGVRLLQVLAGVDEVETHLVMTHRPRAERSPWKLTLPLKTSSLSPTWPIDATT
jgi:3-polyprenyl-4-hydroxybenzoate decarboxylase